MPVQTVVDPKASELKHRDHKNAIQRELDAVRKLQGTLNVAAFEDAYEDEYIWHRIGDKHYSERTVSTGAYTIMNLLIPPCKTWYEGRQQPCGMRHYLHGSGDWQAYGRFICWMLVLVPVQVASYMRAVLRTLAQCHSHHILHRDVKPGEFSWALQEQSLIPAHNGICTP